MKKFKNDGQDVKTISLLDNNASKEIVPMRIVIDTDNEIRATNFYGTSKTWRTYTASQLVFIRATGRQRNIDISYKFSQLNQIAEALEKIKNENSVYFDDM